MLTLVPILVAVYYFDLPKFAVALASPGILAYFLVALWLFVLGVIVAIYVGLRGPRPAAV